MYKGFIRRTLAVICCAVMALSCLSGCNTANDLNSTNASSVSGVSNSESVEKCSQSEIYFGTLMTITLFGETEATNQLIQESFDEIERLENIFSAKLADSELSKLNAVAFNKPVTVSDELFEVISIALKYNKLSESALDISVGKLVNLWAIGTDDERIPSAEELEELKGMDGCQFVVLDDAQKTVAFSDERVQLDLGAVAKGYAADIVKAFILEKNPNAYGILNFGGNIMTIGEKSDGSPWSIGITDPEDPSGMYASVTVKNMCVVTSGNYERYFEQDGVRYHHILDGATGYPAKSGVVSASIIGESSVDCDALSTACFIMGVEKALELIESLDGYEALLVNEDGEEYHTSGMENYNLAVQ